MRLLKPAATPAFVFEERLDFKEYMGRWTIAFSSEAEIGSHKENASEQESKARS
jgi:hypothetical protein